MKAKGKTNASWGGRFRDGPAKLMAEYTDSQHFDRRLYAQDIAASIAHAKMLASQGIIKEEEASLIVDGLRRVKEEIESGSFQWRSDREDVHMNIEARLTELIGDAGKKLHTGRSRNDQVGIDFHLYVSERLDAWLKLCLRLCASFIGQAKKNKDVVLPGYTHMQPAQPALLAHHLLAYANMFRRDAERIMDSLKRVRISPLGAAALAGSAYPIDPLSAARELGFDKIYANSMDAVSDRDFVLEALFVGALIQTHISRFCEEIIIWANPAFNFVKLPDAFSTGSSIMPQKKNPDAAELARGKCGRVYGNLVALLTVIKGLPLAYNRDLQEDKEGFFDTDETVSSSLEIIGAFLDALEFNGDRMLAACKTGYLNATELADYLAAKGVPFRDAHKITGKAVAFAESLGKGLEELDLEQLAKFHPAIGKDIYEALAINSCIKRREAPGGTGHASVRKQLEDFDAWLAEF